MKHRGGDAPALVFDWMVPPILFIGSELWVSMRKEPCDPDVRSLPGWSKAWVDTCFASLEPVGHRFESIRVVCRGSDLRS